jgi:hypothetical protein
MCLLPLPPPRIRFENSSPSQLLLPRAILSTASKLLHSTLELPEKWWVDFEMKQSVCDEICNQIMDLYDESEQ